jgi:hypothetical protein
MIAETAVVNLDLGLIPFIFYPSEVFYLPHLEFFEEGHAGIERHALLEKAIINEHGLEF